MNDSDDDFYDVPFGYFYDPEDLEFYDIVDCLDDDDFEEEDTL